MEHQPPSETGDPNDLPKPLLLAAPFMHVALLPAWLPAGIRCLNPGILAQNELTANPDRFYTPPRLPLTQQQAKAQLQDLLAYASMHNKPGELSSQAASGMDAPFASSSLDFRKELIDIAKISGKVLPPDAASTEEVSHEPDSGLIRSQLMLLLAWVQEERLLELGQLSQKLNQAWGTFDQALGLETADDASGIKALGADAYERSLQEGGSAENPLLPWSMLLEHMLCFVPPGTWLLFFDAQQQAVFEDAGVAFEDSTAECLAEAFPEGGVSGKLAYATAAELLGKKASSEAWLSKKVRVFFPAAG